MRIHIIINIIFHFYFVRPLGAIFSEEQKDTSIELAFKYAVYKINKDRNILPKTTLVYDIQYVPDSTDSFRTSKKVCKSIENGVTAIFGKYVVTSRTNGIFFSFQYNYCQLQRFDVDSFWDAKMCFKVQFNQFFFFFLSFLFFLSFHKPTTTTTAVLLILLIFITSISFKFNSLILNIDYAYLYIYFFPRPPMDLCILLSHSQRGDYPKKIYKHIQKKN